MSDAPSHLARTAWDHLLRDDQFEVEAPTETGWIPVNHYIWHKRLVTGQHWRVDCYAEVGGLLKWRVVADFGYLVVQEGPEFNHPHLAMQWADAQKYPRMTAKMSPDAPTAWVRLLADDDLSV